MLAGVVIARGVQKGEQSGVRQDNALSRALARRRLQ